MPNVSLYGTTLSWSAEALQRDPLADLLAMLPLPPSVEPAAIRCELRPASATAAVDPATEGHEPSFFLGVIQAYEAAPGFLLWDRASRVHVPPEGSPIVAEIAPLDREAVAGSTQILLHMALILALRTQRLFHLHAAALVHPSGASVLVVGSSGAGKTTTTLALLEAGYDYLADDCLFLRRTENDRVEVLSFPREFHLGQATLAAFPRLATFAGDLNGRRDKRPVDPRRAYPGRERAHMVAEPGKLLAIFPTVGADPVTRLSPIAKADAFGHLLASSAALVIEGTAHRKENLAALQILLGAAVCREVVLGRDVLSDAAGALAGPIGAEISRSGRVC